MEKNEKIDELSEKISKLTDENAKLTCMIETLQKSNADLIAKIDTPAPTGDVIGDAAIAMLNEALAGLYEGGETNA